RFRVRKGSLLEEGELLTTLSDNSTVWVYFNVTESEYLDYRALPKEERIASVRLKMANGRIFDQVGTIETIEADFNNETGNIAFRAAFPNPDGLLRHGETGKVLMDIPHPGALLIPQKATFEELDRRYVFVVDAERVVHARAITVSDELPHQYLVSEGLGEDDVILLDGLRKVRDGEHVEVSIEEAQEVFAHLDIPAQ